MTTGLEQKPVVFSLLATVVILIGTIVTVFIPMLTPGMHPTLAGVKPFTALELAGRDIYQREGCNNCHTQTVRPLKTEVLRYGDYSKAGEFAYDYPFLWGSKRTGPDLARIGGKYPNGWHLKHYADPRSVIPESNMPAYGWLVEQKLTPASVEARMKALGFPFTAPEIAGLSAKSEMDALIAYTQVLGTAIPRKGVASGTAGVAATEPNPLKGKPEAVIAGKKLYADNCEMCHGIGGKGDIAVHLYGPNSVNDKDDQNDGHLFDVIQNGKEPASGSADAGGMPPFGSTLDKEKIWSLVTYIRSLPEKK